MSAASHVLQRLSCRSLQTMLVSVSIVFVWRLLCSRAVSLFYKSGYCLVLWSSTQSVVDSCQSPCSSLSIHWHAKEVVDLAEKFFKKKRHSRSLFLHGEKLFFFLSDD